MWTIATDPSVALLALLSAVFFFVNAERTEAEPLSASASPRKHITQQSFDSSHLQSGESVRASRIRNLIDDADQNCSPIVEQSSVLDQIPESRAQLGIREAVETVRRSDVGAWLLQIAADQGVIICLDQETELEAHYRSHLRLIGLNAKLSPAGRIVFLAHELAHVPQHPKFSNNRRFSPTDMLLLQRIREAAAEAVATRVLWQLRDSNIPTPWHEKLTTAYRDIALEFEAEMARNQSEQRELRATRSAFHQWFEAAWRLEIYDDLMLKTLSRIAAEPIELAQSSLYLTEDFLAGIARYADQVFLVDGDSQTLIREFRARKLTSNALARLNEIVAIDGKARDKTVSSSVEKETPSAASPRLAAE
jgi:hypothetical protein